MEILEFLDEVATELTASGEHELPAGVASAIAEEVAESLAAGERAALEDAQGRLERFYLSRLAQAPAGAAAAARGNAAPASPGAAAFALGQIGFAHAMVAREAARRADDRFERLLLSKTLERYVRVLLDAELSGRDIADALGKDEAEVSRRLKVMRQIGAAEFRREGNRIVNFLTPAARMVARARNMGRIGAPGPTGEIRPEVAAALEARRHGLEPQFRTALLFVSPGSRRFRK